MEASTLGLAIIPPSLAILVELLNPVSERVLRASAERDFSAEGEFKDPNFAKIREDVILTATKSANAAVEIAGLTPTLVAAITSGFAVIHELPWPFWATITYVLIFTCVALFLLRLLGGLTFFEIETTHPTFRFPRKYLVEETRNKTAKVFPLSRAALVSCIIYFANFILIAIAFLVYLFLKMRGPATIEM